MRRKRPCRVCRKWFLPHPRAGMRQRVCSAPECQRERHRRSCADWRARHPDYDREERIRRRVEPKERGSEAPPVVDPVAEIEWSAARDVVGVEIAVMMEVLGEVLHFWTRDAVGAQGFGITKQSPQETPGGARDAIGERGPPA